MPDKPEDDEIAGVSRRDYHSFDGHLLATLLHVASDELLGVVLENLVDLVLHSPFVGIALSMA